MRKILPCFFLLCLPFLASAQMQNFVHKPIGKVDRFSSKQDTISFSEYIEEKHGISRRMVSFNHADYKIAIYQTKSGKIKEISDKDGNKILTIPLTGREKNNIQFNDGRQLKWQSTGKTSYAYLKDDREVIKSLHYMMDKQKYFVVQTYDSTITDAILPVITLDYWTSANHTYHNKKRTNAILVAVGASTMLALIRVAMMGSEDDF